MTTQPIRKRTRSNATMRRDKIQRLEAALLSAADWADSLRISTSSASKNIQTLARIHKLLQRAERYAMQLEILYEKK